MANIVSATFDTREDAERAIDWLRDKGVREDAISVASHHADDRDYGYKGGAATLDRPGLAMDLDRDRHNDLATDLDRDGHSDLGLRHDVDHDVDRPIMDRETKEEAADVGKGAAIGAGTGAVAGALFGLAAAFIPGVGPLITAGALATALGAAGGGAAAGAIVGTVSGGLAGALASWGVEESEAKHYSERVERGATYVGVDLDRTTLRREDVVDAFRRFNGRMYSGM